MTSNSVLYFIETLLIHIVILMIIILLLLAGGAVAVLFATGILGPKKEIQLSKTSVKLESGEEIVIMIENYESDLSGVYLIYESQDTKVAKITEEYDDALAQQIKNW